MPDELRVAARPRTAWEAIDLGFALARENGRQAAAAFLSAALPLALGLGWVFRGHPGWAPLLFWWMLPLLDRPLLHVLAKAAFGAPPGLRDTWRQLRPGLRRGLAAQLLWRRLDPARCLTLPVWQLEAPGGRAFRARQKVLQKRVRSQAVLLAVTCSLLTAAGWMALVALAGYLWPEGGTNILERVFASGDARVAWVDLALVYLPMLVMILIEPFHVAGGFGLYLNRRVQLEGWDLELAFRRLGARAAQRALGLLLLLLLVPALRAADPPPPREAIREVLAHPDFATRRDTWVLERRRPAGPGLQVAPPPPWMRRLPNLGGLALKAALPLLLLAGLAYLLWRRGPTLLASLDEAGRPAPPQRLFGLDLRPEALPADPGAAADRLWGAGDVRGALSLLYRAALSHLVQRRGVALGPGATEGECLARARDALAPEGFATFAHLTAAWGALAYGGRLPDEGDRRLCGLWTEHFGGGRP